MSKPFSAIREGSITNQHRCLDSVLLHKLDMIFWCHWKEAREANIEPCCAMRELGRQLGDIFGEVVVMRVNSQAS